MIKWAYQRVHPNQKADVENPLAGNVRDLLIGLPKKRYLACFFVQVRA